MWSFRRLPISLFVLIVVTVLVLYVPMLVYWQTRGDFVPHEAYIVRMMNGDPQVFLEVPNFMYHVLVLVPAQLFSSVAISTWSVIVSCVLYGILALSVASTLFAQFENPTRISIALTVALTSGLLIVAPLTIFTPNNAYFGYFHPYVYHNPTMIPLRPIAWLLLLVAVNAFHGYRPFHGGRVLVAIALSLLSILAKPSFALAMLPAVCALIGLFVLLRKPMDGWTLILGIVIPTVGLLGIQSIIYKGNGIAWSPLTTLDLWAYHYNPLSNQNIVLKFVMSVLFPIVLYLLDFGHARKSILLNLAWLCFLAGVGASYLLIDTGEPPAGNLFWNAQSAVLVLMLASTVYAVLRSQSAQNLSKWRLAIIWGAFILHVVGGILWYVLHLQGQYPDIIYTAW